MKTIKTGTLAMILAAAVVTAGCSKDGGDPVAGQAIRLSGSAVEASATRAAPHDRIVSGQQVGVFISEDAAAPTTTYAPNLAYTADASGALTGTVQYYPLSGNDIRVSAYHPHNAAWTDGSGSYAFTVKTDQSAETDYCASDLLYSAEARFANSNTAHNLAFKHLFARVSYTLTAGGGLDAASLNGATVRILDVLPEVTVDLSDGSISAATGAATDLIPNVTHGAVVAPQTVTAGAQLLRIELADGKTFYYKPVSALTLESGRNSQFDITVNMTGITVAYSVDDWGTGTVDDSALNANEDYLTVDKESFTFDGASHTVQDDATKFIVKTLLSGGATVEVEAGAQSWLGVALSGATAGSRQTVEGNMTTELFLHLGLNNTGGARTGVITVTSGSVVKEIVVEQGIAYKVGDYWPDPNAVYSGGMLVSGTAAQGVVYWLDKVAPGYDAGGGSGGTPMGVHGRVVSLDESADLRWDQNDDGDDGGYYRTDATSSQDGLQNMITVQTFISNNSGKNLEQHFPAFAWCDSKNGPVGTTTYSSGQTGVWYLPTRNDLNYLRIAWNGGTGGTDVNGMRGTFNGWLTSAGGQPLETKRYWSSTEANRGVAWLLSFSNNLFSDIGKDQQYRVRAVLAF